MTATTTLPRAPRFNDPVWRATAIAGSAQLSGLAIGLADRSHPALAVSIALAGVVVAGFVLVPRATAAISRHPALVVVSILAILALVWVTLAPTGIGASHLPRLPGMSLVSDLWGAGRDAVLPVALMTLVATGGLVLIADALRSRLGLTRPRAAAPWQQMTAAAAKPGGFPWGAVAGVLLIGWAAFLGIGIAGPYVAGNGPLQILLLVLVAGAAAVMIGTPLFIASFTRVDRDQAGQAREDERQRFAAHLHDSVLQTLALVQRQAGDPVAVARLARRQEQALRAWMAGEVELTSETLGVALREVVAAVEDERQITIEHSIIGDRPLDAAGEALTAATREALRNATRHAAGTAVYVFAELSDTGAEVFVRDEGEGFELATVPTERRGIRDAIIGRMAAVGGRAAVDSVPGEGTEVALAIGDVR